MDHMSWIQKPSGRQILEGEETAEPQESQSRLKLDEISDSKYQI